MKGKKVYTLGSKYNHMKSLVDFIRGNAGDEVLELCMMETEWLEVADALEKQIPAKVDGDEYLWSCPMCGNEYEMTDERPYFCFDCGQAFDFSDIPDWEDIDWGDD